MHLASHSRRLVLLGAGLAVAAAALLAAGSATSDAQEIEPPAMAAADLQGPDGEEMGEAFFLDLSDFHFEDMPDGLGMSAAEAEAAQELGGTMVFAEVEGLPEDGGFHGFHIHGTGACEPDFTAAGGHFNPGDDPHGEHAGDMPVLLADSDGKATSIFVTDRFSVDDLLTSDDGTAVIAHANPDNYANIPDRYGDPDADTLATGDAGGRLACGVIDEADFEEDPIGDIDDSDLEVPEDPDLGDDSEFDFARIRNEEGQDIGVAFFFPMPDDRVWVSAFVEGLSEGGFHGFHVHGTGECEPDFTAAGGHFNPGDDPHGEHAGDMPVLLANEAGEASADFITDRFTIADLRESEDGAAVIVHANPDNYANIPDRYGGPDADTLATGDAGGRLGCGVIESFEPTVERIAGGDRIETAIEISRELYPEDGTANAVVLAHAGDFADALAGTPLAVSLDAPTLLTSTRELDDRTAAEIDRVLDEDGTVYVLGGTAAVSSGVAEGLQAEFDTTRIGGATRYETSVAIAAALDHPDTVMIARGGKFPDAVTAGAAAAAHGGAVLLTTDDDPHPAAEAYLAEHQPAELYAVGGPAARAHPDAAAVFGEHRWATAVDVAETFFDHPFGAGLARSDEFPDALTGGVFAGRNGEPMLITQPTELITDIEDYICGHLFTLQHITAFGGTEALSEEVLDQVADRLAGEGCFFDEPVPE